MTDAADATPAPPPPPSTPAPGAGWGPKGKQREWVGVSLGSITRLCSYSLASCQKGIGGVLGLVLALLLGIVNWFVLPSEIGNIYERMGQEKPVRGVTGFWNLIPIVGFFIWIWKVQTAMNRLYD